jgi:hypothetical protein
LTKANSTLHGELRELLSRYSEREILDVIRRFLSDDLQNSEQFPKDLSVRPSSALLRQSASKAVGPQKYSNDRVKTPDASRLLLNFQGRDFRTMSMGELRRLASLAGLPFDVKESRARLLTKLGKLVSGRAQPSGTPVAPRPEHGEYRGWVDIIVKKPTVLKPKASTPKAHPRISKPKPIAPLSKLVVSRPQQSNANNRRLIVKSKSKI